MVTAKQNGGSAKREISLRMNEPGLLVNSGPQSQKGTMTKNISIDPTDTFGRLFGATIGLCKGLVYTRCKSLGLRSLYVNRKKTLINVMPIMLDCK